MSDPAQASAGARLVAAVERLFPAFAADPIDGAQSRGNAAVLVIEPSGRVHGRVFGDDPAAGARCLGLAQRKLLQVWRSGHATGEFETLVYSGRLDETTFGLQRPDLIGWEGGVPLEDADGALHAAAFSGFRGVSDVAILAQAAPAAGLRVRRSAGDAGAS